MKNAHVDVYRYLAVSWKKGPDGHKKWAKREMSKVRRRIGKRLCRKYLGEES